MKKLRKFTVTLPLSVDEIKDIHAGKEGWTLDKLKALLPSAPQPPSVGMVYRHTEDREIAYRLVAVGKDEIVVERLTPNKFGPAGERLVQEMDCFEERQAFGQIIVDPPQDSPL